MRWKSINILIRLPQQTLQTQQHRINIVDSTPLILQDVQTDSPREVDVGVVDGRLEQDGWRRVRVVVCELHGELEGEPRIGCIVGALDGRRPTRHILVVREGGYAGRRLGHDVHELFLETAYPN